MEFLRLIQPFLLKNLVLRNRIVMAPMLSRLCAPDGIVTSKLIDYYAARARGGAGLIIVEYCYIDEKESKASHGQLGIYSDQLIAGLGDLAEAIQEWGAKAILQICHAGRCTSTTIMGRQPIAPSAVPSPTGEMTKEMTLDEIEATIESFGEAARRAKTAGFDGVELHGTHGYLMAQFYSPYTNHRTDLFGKDRGLFALQSLDRVRSRIGSDYIVGYRMSAEEFIENGVHLADAKALATRLEARGIDYIHVSAGIPETGHHIVVPIYFSQGHLLHLAEGIKSSVNVPVIAAGAIHDPVLAEEALANNKADLIAMGRALIADPELPNKIRSCQFENIRTCLRCNEGCRSRMPQNKTLRCAINAEVGREREMEVRHISNPKHICVIGGGPAGMEAARTLALRNHRVTLIEKGKELGGLMKYAAVPDFKAELRSFLTYLRTQVEKSRIEILYDRVATLQFVKEIGPDSVVLATGSSMTKPEIPGAERPFVATALELISGKFQVQGKVVVVGGAAMGCEVALHIASSGKKVTIVEMLGEIAMDLEPRCRLALLELLRERRIEILTGWKLERIEEGKSLLIGRDGQRLEVTTESVILAFGLKSSQELLNPLKDNFTEVYAIGDCVEPRKIYQAIHEGAFVGRAI